MSEAPRSRASSAICASAPIANAAMQAAPTAS